MKIINTLKQSFIGISMLLLAACSDVPEIPLVREDKGTFLVHRRQSLIGREEYEIIENADHFLVKSNQTENERGRISGVVAELKLTKNLDPISYEIIRIANGDTTNILYVSHSNDSILVSELFKESFSTKEQNYFPVHSSIPAGMELILYKYLLKNRDSTVITLPRGEVSMKFSKEDVTTIDGVEVKLNRFVVKGINWGTRTVWLDSDNNLVAVVKANTQFRELIKEGYEKALPLFVQGNVEEQMNVLTQYTSALSKDKSQLKALVGADVVTGTSDRTLKNQTIIIDGSIIKEIGDSATVNIPKGAQVFDLSDKTLIPGLWDMHAHSNQVQWGPAYLAGGITTIRDLGNELEFATAFRNAMNSGKAIGPHMLLGGMTDGPGAKGNGVIRATSIEEAEEVVKLYYENGYQQIKIYNSIQPEILKVLAEKAHEKGMTVTGHVPVAVGNTIDAIELGMDQFNHRSLFLSILFPELKVEDLGKFYLADTIVTQEAIENAKQILLKNKAVLDPTIALDVIRYLPYSTPVETVEPDAYRIAYELFEGKRFHEGVSAEQSAKAQMEIKKAMEIIGEFAQAGIPIVAGTDNVVPVFSLYLELETYHKYGNMTPLEAIKTATIIPAIAMGLQDQTGTLEVGKEADIAILNQNPLEDISNVRSVTAVINNGVYYESGPLWEAVDFLPASQDNE